MPRCVRVPRCSPAALRLCDRFGSCWTFERLGRPKLARCLSWRRGPGLGGRLSAQPRCRGMSGRRLLPHPPA
eukprot:11955311-Heterocapsa_arctica.AAC.1